ncbi:MAG: hypothetical protein ACLQDY_25645 [Streptosporangiaceae bacterium]
MRLCGGSDNFWLIFGLGRGDGAWPQLAGWLEQRAAQVLQEPQAVWGHRQAAPAAGGPVQDGPDQAADLLAKSSRPRPYLLAGLADSLDQLAAAGVGTASPGTGRPDGYAQAHAAYAQAVDAIERMRPPDPGLLRRYRVRQAICWLASAQPGLRGQAIGWLSGPDMAASEPASATDAYDLACLYALASEVAGAAADNPGWRVTAARFLVRALIADLPGKTLWTAAAQTRSSRCCTAPCLAS